jgi:hypothetical protein
VIYRELDSNQSLRGVGSGELLDIIVHGLSTRAFTSELDLDCCGIDTYSVMRVWNRYRGI